MATVTINAGSVLFTLANLTQNKIAIANTVLTPFGTGTILANRVVNDYDRSKELSELVSGGYITVTFNNTTLTAADLLNFDRVTAIKPVYTDATRPGPTTVSIGYTFFNTDDTFDNVSDGTNWRDPAGAIT